MAPPCDKDLFAQQKEAVRLLSSDGLAAYDQYLQRLGIGEFLNAEEKEYFVSLNVNDSSNFDEDDEDEDEDEEDDGHLEVDGGTPCLAESASEIKIETRIKFSPGICDEIFKMIRNCSHSIKIAMFMFTEKSIFKQICEKKKSNPEIDVFILVDKTQFDEFLAMATKVIKNDFKNKKVGINVKDITKPGNATQQKPQGKAHEKFMIVDESLALTGSFNFTWCSEYVNYEQVIISNDKEAIVTPLLNHFKKMSRRKKYQIL